MLPTSSLSTNKQQLVRLVFPASIKASNEEVEEVLNKNGINFEKVEWTQDAYVLKDNKESDIEALDIYKDGKIYLQSLSSMLPPIILEPQEGKDIL